MRPTTPDRFKQLSKSSIFSLFALILTCGTASPLFAAHDHTPEPDNHNPAEHYEGDGHDHHYGETNKAPQLNNEGIALYKAKDYKEAAKKFKQAVTEAPNIGEIHAMLGKTQVKLGKFEEAVATLKTSLKLTKNPTINRISHKSLARAYIGLEKFDTAREEINLYKEMSVSQNSLTPKTEQIIKELYKQLK